MNAETLKLFRINILLQLRAAGKLGLTSNELVVGAKSQGFASTDSNEVGEEIQYLEDKKHVEQVPAEISPEVTSYRITASGRDWLATQNL